MTLATSMPYASVTGAGLDVLSSCDSDAVQVQRKVVHFAHLAVVARDSLLPSAMERSPYRAGPEG